MMAGLGHQLSPLRKIYLEVCAAIAAEILNACCCCSCSAWRGQQKGLVASFSLLTYLSSTSKDMIRGSLDCKRRARQVQLCWLIRGGWGL